MSTRRLSCRWPTPFGLGTWLFFRWARSSLKLVRLPLLIVTVWFLLGTHYMCTFTSRPLRDPYYDLLIMKIDDPGRLASFRHTARRISEDAEQELRRLVALRKSTRKTTVKPENFDHEMEVIGERLQDIMWEAKNQQIPKRYEKEYKDVLRGIFDTYRSWRELEAAMATNLATEKEHGRKLSIEHSKRAAMRFEIRRPFWIQSHCDSKDGDRT